MHPDRLLRLALLPALLAVLPGAAAAQGLPRVDPGWGVDTTASGAWSDVAWQGDVPAIYQAWRSYLRSQPGGPAGRPFWSAPENAWPAYDLTAAIAYQGFPATVLDIHPAFPGQDDVFVVRTLFAAAVAPDGVVKPIALTRVFALRQNDGWLFANALPRLTAAWPRARVGPIAYVFPPGRRFDRARAERAVHFADSLAAAYGVPKVADMTYYMADAPEQLLRVMGVDWTVPGQGHGYAATADHLLLSGDSAFGEENRHELTHYVLSPLVVSGRIHPLVNEGVASWQGGSLGLTFPRMMREYAAFLRTRPAVTLDTVLESGTDTGVRPAGALLALMVFERGGVPAIKQLLAGGRSDEELRRTLEQLLGMPWAAIETAWHRRVLAFGAGR